MRNMLLIGATAAALAIGGGTAWAGDRTVGSSPYKVLEPQSKDLKKPPEKPNAAIQQQESRAAVDAPAPQDDPN